MTKKGLHHGGTEFAEFGVFLIKNSSLRVLSASAVSLIFVCLAPSW
jgi:hypothetical protein